MLLPVWCVPRRAYSVDVIGAALLGAATGRGRRTVAAALDVPTATLRGWLRGLIRGATAVTARAVTVAQAAGGCVLDGRSPAAWAGSTLAETVATLATAARAVAAVPPAVHNGARAPWTGIDYLGLLAARQQRELAGRLRLADPSTLVALAMVPPWHLVNVITGGRLLTGGPSG